ncbi:MAG: low temperature requirement protein A [Myxococcales bacterium]|nr:low temperature requirement protein A [Myxococcales bacterium]
MQNRWFHPPALHSPGPGRERRVGWLELFYDLIYVALIIQLGNMLSEHVGLAGTVAFAGLFVPIWFTWTGFTFYSNHFVTDDFVHRALVFVQMFAIGGVAVSVPGLFRKEFFAFSAFYALARLIMVALYFRAWRHVSVARALARRYVIGFSVGALLWFSAAFLPWPWVLPVWGAAMLIDLNSVLSQTARTLTAQHPPDTQHATERYGLLTIIVLGESFVKVLSAVSADGLHRTTFLMCGCVLFICCSLWWIYFDDVAGSRIKPGRLTPFFWIYSHLPLTMAITSVGVAAKKAVFFDPGSVAPTKYRWFLCGTLAFALFWVAVIDSITERRQAELSDRTRVQDPLRFGVLRLAAGANRRRDACVGLRRPGHGGDVHPGVDRPRDGARGGSRGRAPTSTSRCSPRRTHCPRRRPRLPAAASRCGAAPQARPFAEARRTHCARTCTSI